MISGVNQKWPLIFLTVVMATPQFPMPYPMFGPPPMMQMPMMPPPSPMMMAPPTGMDGPPSIVSLLPQSPLNMNMQIGLAIVSDENSTTTTSTEATTTKENNDIAIAVPMPMPMGMPMPMAMPGPSPVLFSVPGMMSSVCRKNRKHPNCPPCPPCSCSPCTPAFFSYCSSCHQKCRCRDPKDVPLVPPPKAPFSLPGPAFPMPYPGHLPQSPNMGFVPYPPQNERRIRPKNRRLEVENSESDSCESFDKTRRHKRKRARKNRSFYDYRRSNRRLDIDRSDNFIARPVLNFLAPDGRVKLARRLNKNDAYLLMSDDEDTSEVKHSVEVVPEGHRKNNKTKVISYPYVEKGKKKLVFKPPPNMMVGNLSVSFNT